MQIPTMMQAYNFGTSLNGVFSDLQKLNVPWKSENMEQSLDLAYLGLHSGCKLVMPFIAQLMANNNGTLSDENRTTLAQMLVNLYGVQWQKQWDTLSFDYNPIENYDMTEEESTTEDGKENRDNTYTRTNNGTDTLTQTGTITHDNPQTVNVGAETTNKDTTTQTGTVTTQHPTTTTRDSTNTAENSGDTTNNVYGFNSEDGVPSDAQNQSQNGKQTINETTTVEDTTTETRDTTDTHNATVNENRTTTIENRDTETREINDKREINDTGNDTEKGVTQRNNQLNRTLTRHGNIGVTTSQQMIESERQLWIWNYFQNIVFPDIDKTLTLAIY